MKKEYIKYIDSADGLWSIETTFIYEDGEVICLDDTSDLDEKALEKAFEEVAEEAASDEIEALEMCDKW